MKIININLGKDLKELRIIPISDVHIGDKLTNYKLLKEVLETIKNTPNVYTIINGDFCNTALKNSKSDIYSEELTPMQEINRMLELLTPIKEKILVIGTGNHESRITKETGIDVVKLVAKQLGIEDRYADSWWYLFLRFGEKQKGRKIPVSYQISGYHGSGGGRKVGSKANRLEEMSQTVIADLYIMSHTHKPLSTKGAIYLPDYGNNTLNKKQLYYLMTNSFLDYGGYGEVLGFTPTDNTPTEAVLDGTKRKIKVIL
jgi:predicted MPP superfamily phosphohydrolase